MPGFLVQFARTDDDPVLVHQPHLRAKIVALVDDLHADGLAGGVKKGIVPESRADLRRKRIAIWTSCCPCASRVLESRRVSRGGMHAARRKHARRKACRNQERIATHCADNAESIAGASKLLGYARWNAAARARA